MENRGAAIVIVSDGSYMHPLLMENRGEESL